MFPEVWPPEQQDNVVEVELEKHVEVWTVNLNGRVKEILSKVHAEFFRNFETYVTSKNTTEVPSALRIFKRIKEAERKKK